MVSLLIEFWLGKLGITKYKLYEFRQYEKLKGIRSVTVKANSMISAHKTMSKITNNEQISKDIAAIGEYNNSVEMLCKYEKSMFELKFWICQIIKL